MLEQSLVFEQIRSAREAQSALGLSDHAQRCTGLLGAARAIEGAQDKILAANAADMEAAQGLSEAKRDRLHLDASRVRDMAEGLCAIAALEDPLHQVQLSSVRPNGLRIEKITVPLGVIGVIYEARPNVTVDAAGLCCKAGNAVVLRCGSECLGTALALRAAFVAGLESAGLPGAVVQMVGSRDRSAITEILHAEGLVDVVIPRGGRGLIETVMAEARMPYFAHLEGVCHTYLHGAADAHKARDVSLNAKLRRPGVCGAMETLLVDKDLLEAPWLRDLLGSFLDAGCALRVDEALLGLDERMTLACEEDWGREYLDLVLSVKVVEGVEGALAHIAQYGSGHTESILTEDCAAAERFMSGVDSAIVMHNASTQFADGGEFGFGAEIGISTGRLHARGPVGAQHLVSHQYRVHGDGHARP